jgi:hypothetical protein
MMIHQVMMILAVFSGVSLARHRSTVVRSKMGLDSTQSVGFSGAEDVGPKKTHVATAISSGAIAKSTQDFSHSDSVADDYEPNIVEKMEYEGDVMVVGDEPGSGLPMWLFVLCAAAWAVALAKSPEKRQMTKDVAKDKANMLLNIAAPLIQEAMKVIGIAGSAATILKTQGKGYKTDDSDIDCSLDDSMDEQNDDEQLKSTLSKYEDVNQSDVSAGIKAAFQDDGALQNEPLIQDAVPQDVPCLDLFEVNKDVVSLPADADMDSLGLMETEVGL